MKRWIMRCAIFGLTSMTLFANDMQPYSRDAVQAEILQSLAAVEKAREETIKALEKTVQEVESARAKRSGEESATVHTQIVEAQSVSKIAESTALVELAKVEAKKTIVKAVDRVESVEKSSATEEEIIQIRQEAMKEIADAIALVEVTKAKATKVILEATGEVELSRLERARDVVDAQAEITIAKNRSAVKIAQAVSAVEVARAASHVEMSKTLDPEEVARIRIENEGLSLAQIKARAQAVISSATAKVEISKANAMADIAKALATVEVAKSVRAYKDGKHSSVGLLPETYPKELLYFKKH